MHLNSSAIPRAGEFEVFSTKICKNFTSTTKTTHLTLFLNQYIPQSM